MLLEQFWYTRDPEGQFVETIPWLGVMKVVKGLDSGARGICQKPPLASSLLRTEAPDRSARVSSTLGIG